MKFKTGEVVFPLGAASYLYQKEKDLLAYIRSQIRKNKIKISIGAQPNSPLHLGTIIVFCLAFALGKELKEYDENLEVTVLFEMIDTAPGKIEFINGEMYQVSLKESGIIEQYINQYYEVLEHLSNISGIPYEVRRQEEFNKHPSISKIVKKIIEKKELIAPILEPINHILRIRSACPICGLTDKQGIHNQFVKNEIICYCPIHGNYSVNIDNQSERLEYNTPLRNLIRGIVYSIDNQDENLDYEWIRITGSDYAGFYQEQVFYRCVDLLGESVSKLPIIVYAPLVVDWSGAKLSKSLYKENVYNDLPEFVMNYESLKEEKGEKGLDLIFEEVLKWIKEPYKLFRNYSIYYFLEVLKE